MMIDKLVLLIKNKISVRLKEIIKNIYENIIVFFDYTYDIFRYYRYSGMTLNFKNKKKLRSVITINYHAIEKGLSLNDPRSGFGQPVLKRLIYFINMYVSLYGFDETIIYSISTIKKYVDFHKIIDIKYEYLDAFLFSYKKNTDDFGDVVGGIKSIEKKDILTSIKGDFRDFAFCRYSIRDFDEALVSDNLIRGAIDIARKTPSVCNRPTTNIYIYSSKDMKKNILSLQNGNRGFGNKASHVIIVTSELACFNGAKERNQSFIDGGLMAMSLVYALHSKGLGTCFLNWAVGARQDVRLRRIISIPASNNIITLIAVGSLPERFNVAQSNKVDFNDVVHFEKLE